MADKKISQLTAATLPFAGTEVLPIVQSSTTKKVSVDNLAAGNVKSNATTGVLQITGPATGTTRVMTTPNANFTVARTDAGQTFSGTQTFGGGASVTSGKLSVAYGAGGDYVAEFQNTTSATPYCVWIKDAATPTAGYPLLIVSNSTGSSAYFRIDSSNGNTTFSTGNIVQGTAAKGINFTANTGAAGMTSQLLNWYEEGTWTTTVSNTSNFTGTPTLSNGKYTRIGRLVTIEGKFSGTVTTGSTNTYFQFTLPFNRSASTDGGAGTVFTNTNLKIGGIYNASADTTTAYLVMPAPSAQPSGADTFFFSYTYMA